MWDELKPLGVYALLALILACIVIYFVCDHALARFRRNPDPARIDAMQRYNAKMGIALEFFMAGIVWLSCVFVWPPDRVFFFLIFALACVGAVLLRALFGSHRGPLAPERVPANGGGRLTYFAAKSLVHDPDKDNDESGNLATFKVFIAPTMLCGARTSDNVNDSTGVLTRAFWNAYPVRDSGFYDAFDVTSPDFCRMVDDNFQIAWRDVAGIGYHAVTKASKAVDDKNSGSIIIRLKAGGSRELVLLGKRDAQALRGALQGMTDGAG
jgi:hypothetical protein